MTRDPRVYLAQILERSERIERYVAKGEEAFQRDTMIQDAVIRNFEVIGEAIRRLPEAYRSRHPEIPWRLMARFREVLIHGYEGIDLRRVWLSATVDLPEVIPALRKILPPLDQLERELAGEEPGHDEND